MKRAECYNTPLFFTVPLAYNYNYSALLRLTIEMSGARTVEFNKVADCASRPLICYLAALNQWTQKPSAMSDKKLRSNLL
jgi:hypothetical protein